VSLDLGGFLLGFEVTTVWGLGLIVFLFAPQLTELVSDWSEEGAGCSGGVRSDLSNQKP